MLESPSGATGSLLAAICSTARSADGSCRSTCAGSVRPSESVTSIVWAPCTTWSLVAMTPSAATTNPVPVPSSGTSWPELFWPTSWVCTVTTEGSTRARTAGTFIAPSWDGARPDVADSAVAEFVPDAASEPAKYPAAPRPRWPRSPC